MSIRLCIGQFLLKVSYYLRRLYLVILTPLDLIESNKLQYGRGVYVKSFGNSDFELLTDEKEILDKFKIKKGKFLILGCGGGRESIALARLGFEVLGIDFVKGMIDAARTNAQQLNLNPNFHLQDMMHLSFPERTFDYIGLFSGTYSSIPTSSLRKDLLRQVRRILKPEGLFIFAFLTNKNSPSACRTNILRIIAYLTLGNRGYQSGDELRGEKEFLHIFHNKEDVLKEIEESGFRAEDIFNSSYSNLCYAIVRA